MKKCRKQEKCPSTIIHVAWIVHQRALLVICLERHNTTQLACDNKTIVSFLRALLYYFSKDS